MDTLFGEEALPALAANRNAGRSGDRSADRPGDRTADGPGDGSASRAPLAVRMRPRSVHEVLGQDHLLAEGAPLRRLIDGGSAASIVLYGPPGTGKTTLARLVSGVTGRRFEALSALSSGVKEVRAVIEAARRRLAGGGDGTVLFIDEVHRFNRTQQDQLLGAVEDGTVLLVAATTENPFFSMVSPLLSRSLVLQLHPLSDEDVRTLIGRALVDEHGLAGAVTVDQDAERHLVRLAAGDARRALTALEAAADAVLSRQESTVDLATVEAVVDQAALRYDRSGDQHYDVISAFIKSIRGSDVDAALHYLARMIEAGEDPRFIARRLVVHASEDVGMADPSALQTAVAAASAVQLIGMPEARLALAQATIHLATAPKSNAVITALGRAAADVRDGLAGEVPRHLRDGHYSSAQRLGNALGYQYPHDVDGGVAAQQYPPDELVGRDYYIPTDRGAELAIAERLPKLRGIIRRAPGNGSGQ